MMSPSDLCGILQSGRFDLSDEKACQAEIAAWLEQRLPDGVPVTREHRLSAGDIVDFLIDGVALEIKMHGAQPTAVLRQLARYAAHDAVRAVVLASNRAVRLPPEINGKPIFNVSLGKAWL